MKTLLLFAYYFPPVGGGGAQRPFWLGQHLPELGWRVIVVTADHAAGRRSRWAPIDDSLVTSDIPGLDVRKVPAQPGHVSLLTPPHRRFAARWVAPATEAAMRILEEEDVDVVGATMSPFELAEVAFDVGAAHELPVLLDLRDPWALDGWVKYRSWVDWFVDAQRMRRSLGRADAVVANTSEAARVLVGSGGAAPDRTHHVPNGWSEEVFDVVPDEAGATMSPDARLTLVHTGSFHTADLRSDGFRSLLHHRPEPIDPAGRTPVPLVRALEGLIGRDPSYRERVRFVHVGMVDEATRSVIEAAPVDTVITGYLPHAESVAWLHRADVLFLPLHGLPPGRRSRIVPGKTYEYLAAGRPILAAVPPGEARDLAATVPGSELVDPVDHVAIEHAIVSLVAQHEADGGLPRAPSPLTPDYERSVLAARFVDVLDGLLA